MNGIRLWTLVVAAGAVAAMTVPDVLAQAVHAKAAGAAPGVATAGSVRIRSHALTGDGPRGLVKFPSVFVPGRTPAKDWAELQVTFDTDPEWIDELVFVYYALLYNKTTAEYTFLKGQVTCVDVARGRNHQSAVYIRPNTLAHYGDVCAVAVEVLSGGDVVASQSEGKLPKGLPLPAEWWKNAKSLPPAKEGLLFPKSQTPYAYMMYDDYEAVK